MEEHFKEFVESIWRDGWEHGSHCSTVTFDEWFEERFAKQIAQRKRKMERRSNGVANNQFDLTQDKPSQVN